MARLVIERYATASQASYLPMNAADLSPDAVPRSHLDRPPTHQIQLLKATNDAGTKQLWLGVSMFSFVGNGSVLVWTTALNYEQ